MMIYISHFGSAGFRRTTVTRECVSSLSANGDDNRRHSLHRVLQSVTRRTSLSSMLNWHGWQLRNRCAGAAFGSLLGRISALSSFPSKIERFGLTKLFSARRRSSPWMATTSNRRNPRNRCLPSARHRLEMRAISDRHDVETKRYVMYLAIVQMISAKS